MIQPVNAFNPQASFRGSDGTYGKAKKGLTQSSKIALINAGGVAAAAGGLTAAISRGYTSNWTQAAVLGLCVSFLSMFFMTPQLIERTGLNKLTKKPEADSFIKSDAVKTAELVRENFRPATKKLVQFRSDAASNP